MNQIAELLPADNIALELDAPTKSRLFEATGALFERDTGIARATIVSSLSAREKLGSTGLGQGVAIPHGRLKGLSEARGAFVRLANIKGRKIEYRRLFGNRAAVGEHRLGIQLKFYVVLEGHRL